MSHFYNPRGGPSRHLLVYLHGHGDRPDGLPPLVREHHDDGFVRLCPVAPIPAGDGFSWFETGPRGVDAASLRRTVDDLTALVDATRHDLGVEWSDVVVGGFSQGAAAALALAAAVGGRWTDGERLGGLLLQAGFVPEVFDDEIALDRVAADAVLLQHGSDDDVVPAFMSNDLADVLGAVPTVVEVEVDITIGGHSLTPSMVDRAARWLTARVG